MISVGIMETTGTLSVSVATGMGCRSAFDGFEPINPSRGGVKDHSGRFLYIGARMVERDTDGPGAGSVHGNKSPVV